jgi:hypothetical protein
MRLVDKRIIDPSNLATHPVSLADIGAALETAAAGGPDFVKAVVHL